MAMQKGQCLFILFAAVSPGSGHRRGVSYREGFGQGPSPNGLGNQGPLTPFFFLSLNFMVAPMAYGSSGVRY